ncbi:MAG: MerR family transcriptional regulator [Burkholderiales bacterium]|nr:MerR family transcriptional regulator [Burkholderiales bacterium]
MKDALTACLVEEMTIEEAAAATFVEVEWLLVRVEEGLFPGASRSHFSSRLLARARRMRDLERNFDASPELAALFADILEENDELKIRLRCAE